MPFEVTNIRPNPRGGDGLSEKVAEEIASTYERIAAAGGRIVGAHTLDIAQYPQSTEELFLVAEVPVGGLTQPVITIEIDP